MVPHIQIKPPNLCLPPFGEYHEMAAWHSYDTDEMETRLITFLPYPNFRDCARCLDDKRLGKQRVEARTIIQAETYPEVTHIGWRNHPASLMWRGFIDVLCEYYNEMVFEWIARGFANTLPIIEIGRYRAARMTTPKLHPPWLGMPELHSSHRAALLAKNPDHYSKFKWGEPHVVSYFWPVNRSPKPCYWSGHNFVGEIPDEAATNTSITTAEPADQ